MVDQKHFGSRLKGSWLVVIAVLAACLGGLGATVAFSQISHSQTVLVVTQTVWQGQVIAASDLGLVEVRGSGLPVVDAAEQASVIGQRALRTLVAGALLTPGSYGQLSLATGLAQLQLRLEPSQLPTGPLPGGQTLLLIGLPEADDPEVGPLLVGARVVIPPVAQVDGTIILDVAVPVEDSSSLAPYLLSRRIVVVVGGQGRIKG